MPGKTRERSATPACLALDAMGGDHGPAVVVPAALAALARDPHLQLSLVGDKPAIEALLGSATPRLRERLDIVHTEAVISSDATARAALRSGKGTSLWTALERVADGRAQACVSAGNTVALMTLGIKIIGRLPGIKRPALMSSFPTSGGLVGMLDLGANLNVDARNLFQFALMGAVVRARHDGAGKQPTIGLLNVGHEDSKGLDVLREAHDMLRDSDLNYQGFIEGHDIFSGKVQLAVCDGFAGNLILKASEGLADMLFTEFRQALTSDTRSRIGAWLARPALRRMLARLDPDKHNGAPLLGLNGVVVKSHGRSDVKATTYAILEAAREVERHVPQKIAKTIREHGAEDLT
jgi:glycerol-3-phosphate acyltransferase PlsX